MSHLFAAAASYAGAVLAAGFVLGTIRTLWLAPRVGELAAVALELPLVLALSWVAAAAVLRRWPLPGVPARLALGAAAFALLMTGEAVLALAFGRSLGAWLAAMATAPGALGLAGQVAFALIPALRR